MLITDWGGQIVSATIENLTLQIIKHRATGSILQVLASQPRRAARTLCDNDRSVFLLLPLIRLIKPPVLNEGVEERLQRRILDLCTTTLVDAPPNEPRSTPGTSCVNLPVMGD